MVHGFNYTVVMSLMLHCSSLLNVQTTHGIMLHMQRNTDNDKHKHRLVDFLLMYVCCYEILLLHCR